MCQIVIQRLPHACFHETSLDSFIRHQDVYECWRKVEGEWKLLPIAFTEEWDQEHCREEARELLSRAGKDMIAFAAMMDDQAVGYITVITTPIGSRGQYLQLEAYQVSQPYRGKGIGKRLFAAACDAARELGAEKLYISAHSSKESQAAYRALGCVHAQEIISRIAEEEPCDVQLEYLLRR